MNRTIRTFVVWTEVQVNAESHKGAQEKVKAALTQAIPDCKIGDFDSVDGTLEDHDERM